MTEPNTEAVTVGHAVAPFVELARCCANCANCVLRCEYDDPIEYACVRVNAQAVEPNGYEETYAWADDDPRWAQHYAVDAWWHENFVRAGMICAHFKGIEKKRIVKSFRTHFKEVTGEDHVAI